MSILPYINSGAALTVFLAGVPHALANSHPNFDAILDMIRKGELTDDRIDEIRNMVDHRAAIESQIAKGDVYGKVTVGIDSILYNGTAVNSYLANRMLEMLGAGHDVAPWAKFMDKLYENPSKTAVDELYLWLEKAQMPLTPDGNFLAYKKVQDDFTSYHRGPNGKVVTNNVGETVEMARNEVDDQRNRTCSAGLHFCSWHYLPSYYGGQGKVIILEINPADVVSIPSDYDNAKGRAWRYVVKGVIPEKDAQFAFDGTPLYAGDYDDFGL
jgi:hypothetical protein